ncbi:MAG: hypothetical protein ILP10_05785 [Lachnospiraceae bacterium]|nr:hypothetical protein [Lachnospiraceae bacterium]
MSVVWSVLLVILKIIGFTLLGLIGLLLLLLLIVLFVPVRYKASASYHDEVKADARVNWLLRLVRVRFRLEGKENELKAHILCFKILDGNKDTKKAGDAAETTDESAEKADESAEKAGEAAEKNTDNVDASEGTARESTELQVRHVDERQDKPTVTKAEKEKIKAQKQRLKAEKKREKAERKRLKAEEKERKKGEKEEKKAAGSLESKLDSLKKKFEDLRDKKDTIMGYVNDPANRRALSTAWNGVKKFFKHILPRKVRGYVHFGLDDPATTGKILAGAGMFYAKYGKWLTIDPDFENKVIEGDLFLKGHIRLITLLVIALRVYFNKDVKYVIKEYKDIKENGLFRDKAENAEKGEKV